MPSRVSEQWDVPDAWRAAAEEVRHHLCSLRGGGLFLSSTEALQLLRWLEAGVPACDVLRALERACEARRRKRSRIPLTLSHARPHLGRPTKGVFSATVPDLSADAPFAPVVRALQVVPRSGPRLALEQALMAIPTADEGGVEAALRAIRAYHEQRWTDLGADGQAALKARALAELGDLVHLVDEGTVAALVEEGSMDLLRQELPCLSAASLWDLVQHHAH